MPVGRSWPLVLADETTVELRPVRSDDAAALADGYQQLSAHSAYSRFHTLYSELSPTQLRYFTELDHHDHEALGAVLPDTGEGLGIARYVRDTDDPTHAELADWPGPGARAARRVADGRARRASPASPRTC